MSEQDERRAVVNEAATWIGTPFHHEARIKHAGVDCAQLIYATFRACDLIPEFDVRHYPQDWHLHRGEERYLSYVLEYADEMPQPSERTPLPADIVLFRFGRAYSHGAIVANWPHLIHAYIRKPVAMDHLDQAAWLKWVWENVKEGKGAQRPFKVFTLKRWNS
jgi:cell wall-associated NlpC family hydrolase